MCVYPNLISRFPEEKSHIAQVTRILHQFPVIKQLNRYLKTRLYLYFKKYYLFLFKINFFIYLKLFSYINFKNKKNIILIYFNIKNILKNKYNHTPEHFKQSHTRTL